MLNLTKAQRTALILLALFFLVDNGITLYGAYLWPGTFYEANPIFRYFMGSPLGFIGALTALKLGALGLFAWFAHYCNTSLDRPFNGEKWGMVMIGYPGVLMAGSLIALTWMNIINLV